MLKRYMHKRERYFAMLNDNRVVRPFEWGAEFIGENANGSDPRHLFEEFSRKAVASSSDYFALPDLSGDVEHELTDRKERRLQWKSPVASESAENDVVRALLFPFEKNKHSAVIILPHWN